ncbi:hypothetical protein T01_5366 [Trichinella spiralis]|uniref:Uncharacterized protein n=1 Tax=Trichinella spiralis TaxID=6334 RepID=A0A0V1BFY7_TRISP|nr:hypothetical protein T01_5366 [Trichinella spiralis]
MLVTTKQIRNEMTMLNKAWTVHNVIYRIFRYRRVNAHITIYLNICVNTKWHVLNENKRWKCERHLLKKTDEEFYNK